MSNQELLAQQCQRTTVDMLLDDPVHKAMPENIKTIEERLFWTSTDALVGDVARQSAHPERYLDPKQYEFYAGRNAEELNQLRNHYEQTGFQKGVASATGKAPVVQPISPSAGGSPVNMPTQRVDMSNMTQVAKQYLADVGRQV